MIVSTVNTFVYSPHWKENMIQVYHAVLLILLSETVDYLNILDSAKSIAVLLTNNTNTGNVITSNDENHTSYKGNNTVRYVNHWKFQNL